MSPWRVVFMGTPEFAVPVLQSLLAGPDPVVGVFTRPDKPVGRGMKLQAPPVKELALAHGLPVVQPLRLRDADAVAQLRAMQPDVAIVAAYGQILSREILDIPTHGCLNVHASLLPRWRGADPIRHAILAGDRQSGVTIMGMEEGLDTGPIYRAQTLEITPDMTGGALYEALSRSGGPLLMETLAALKRGDITPVAQPAAGVTHAGKLDDAYGRMDWREEAVVARRRILAMAPTPGVTSRLGETPLKLFEAVVACGRGVPGQVLACHKQGLEVACGHGSLVLTRVQPAGKKPMAAADWLRGRPVVPGESFQ